MKTLPDGSQPVKHDSLDNLSIGLTAAQLVRQHAIWSASQPGADCDSIASVYLANRRLGSPLTLKAVKRLVRRARPAPEIAHYRDPIHHHHVRQAIAEAQDAIVQLPWWPGAFAQGCRRAMLFALKQMRHVGKREIYLSRRGLADGIGVTKETAGRYLLALCGATPARRATVPTVLTCKSYRTTDPTAAFCYRLRPQRGWRAPFGASRGGTSLCVSNSAEKGGRNSAENARKMNTRQLLLDTIFCTPCGSAPELAAAAGVSQKVAELHLTAFRKNALVQKVGGVYRLMIPRPLKRTPDLAHDAYRHRGLGKTSAEAETVIERGSIRTAEELALAADMTSDRAERVLTKLRKAGVIEKFAGVYQWLDKRIETVAQEQGTAGVGTRQRANHAHEQEQFRATVANGEIQPGWGKKALHTGPKFTDVPSTNWEGEHAFSEKPVTDSESFDEILKAA